MPLFLKVNIWRGINAFASLTSAFVSSKYHCFDDGVHKLPLRQAAALVGTANYALSKQHLNDLCNCCKSFELPLIDDANVLSFCLLALGVTF